MNRRSLFKTLTKAAAIIALAPQLAFRVKPEKFDPGEATAFWLEPDRLSLAYTDEYREWFEAAKDEALQELWRSLPTGQWYKITDDIEGWKRGEGQLFIAKDT